MNLCESFFFLYLIMKIAGHHYWLIFHLYCYNKMLKITSLYHNIIINDNTQDLNPWLKCDINC